MQTFQYEISVEARSELEADQKMQALTVLASKLNEKELTKLAQVIQHDPVKTSLAKKYLNLV